MAPPHLRKLSCLDSAKGRWLAVHGGCACYQHGRLTRHVGEGGGGEGRVQSSPAACCCAAARALSALQGRLLPPHPTTRPPSCSLTRLTHASVLHSAACFSVCLPACLPACSCACLPAYLPVRLPSCSSACLLPSPRPSCLRRCAPPVTSTARGRRACGRCSGCGGGRRSWPPRGRQRLAGTGRGWLGG